MTTTTMLTPTDIYALRETNLLPVPRVVQDMIAAMQLAPVSQTFFRKAGAPKKPINIDRAAAAVSWRTTVLATLKKTEFKHDDTDYEAITAIVNKVAPATVPASSTEIVEILKRRADQEFRMRVVTFMFNRGVSMPFFSKMMANIFELVHKQIPEIKEDLQFSASLDIFNKMFDQSDTVLYPSVDDPEYNDKVCAWSKKKEIRRGFGMFLTELHIRGLVEEDVISGATQASIAELCELIVKPSEPALAENVDSLVTFLFESTKVIAARFGKEHSIVKLVAAKGAEIYKMPKPSTPCLGMRSRFKLDDISKF